MRSFWFGAHVSIAGGIDLAPHRAYKIGATAFGLFTKNQRQWNAAPLKSEQCNLFKQACIQFHFSSQQILPHASYLINLASPDEVTYQKAQDALCVELERCNQLGLTQLNVHPGSHLNRLSREEAISRVAAAINAVLNRTSNLNVKLVLENTAGQGSSIGHRLDDLGRILYQVEDSSRIGICLDTCHLFAAGYSLSTENDCERVFEQVDQFIGMNYLSGFHLNGSLKPCDSKVDRHANLNAGCMGLAIFEYLTAKDCFKQIPMILETPDSSLWAEEIEFLNSCTRKLTSF